jgi:hypothetical protein
MIYSKEAEQKLNAIFDYEYVAGFDPYEKVDEPVNFYHKLRKFLGMKFKTNSYCSVYKRYTDGRIEHIK